ncbi:MAG TPA: type I-E CRISPR-associated protein Cse2/CasB [Blastocatellia bacterium]|nr:type I-E CRISPR-associated protein Cse2/CasB [Blastocatellia bacterium]
MSLDERQKKFIGYLLNLAKEGKEDRGALADLRSGLGKGPGEMSRVHKHVVPYLPEENYNDRWYYLTATLFGAFPQHQEGRSLGAAFRPLEQKSDSMEARFIALLNAHPEDLGGHIRHAVSLLKANKQPLDWFRLFKDLLQWDHPNRCIQLRWARDFYKADSNSTPREEDQDHE